MSVTAEVSPVQLPDLTTCHVWQPFPFGEHVLFQCSHCRVLADSVQSVDALPGVCPGESPRLPHILRIQPAPGGERPTCLGCTLPPADAWVWDCGGSYQERPCDLCGARRDTTEYSYYHLAHICNLCRQTRDVRNA